MFVNFANELVSIDVEFAIYGYARVINARIQHTVQINDANPQSKVGGIPPIE